ncbi:MAG: hypothetical protein HDQ87_06445 [Clostridia bacterium]|nr:hypothetical protein [Clostridia bacterium]
MPARTGRRDVHIHLYMDDPDERRAYDFLQKKKNQNRHWIADAINAYADSRKKNKAQAVPAECGDGSGPALSTRLAAIEQRLASIEQALKERPAFTVRGQADPPSAPAAQAADAGPYKSGAGFSDADLEAEAAQIPKEVLDGFKMFTG